MIKISKSVKPSERGELEISSVNEEYLKRGDLNVKVMGRGFTWLDTGTHESLLQASEFVRTIEERQGLKIACIEEIAYNMGYIDETKLLQLAEPLLKSGYGEYLISLMK